MEKEGRGDWGWLKVAMMFIHMKLKKLEMMVIKARTRGEEEEENDFGVKRRCQHTTAKTSE